MKRFSELTVSRIVPAGFLLAGAALATASLVVAHQERPTPRQTVVTTTTAPCPAEDGGPVLPCFWDGAHRGHPGGRSYTVVRIDPDHVGYLYTDGTLIITSN